MMKQGNPCRPQQCASEEDDATILEHLQFLKISAELSVGVCGEQIHTCSSIIIVNDDTDICGDLNAVLNAITDSGCAQNCDKNYMSRNLNILCGFDYDDDNTLPSSGALEDLSTCPRSWIPCCPGELGASTCRSSDCPDWGNGKPCVGTWIKENCAKTCADVAARRVTSDQGGGYKPNQFSGNTNIDNDTKAVNEGGLIGVGIVLTVIGVGLTGMTVF